MMEDLLVLPVPTYVILDILGFRRATQDCSSGWALARSGLPRHLSPGPPRLPSAASGPGPRPRVPGALIADRGARRATT